MVRHLLSKYDHAFLHNWKSTDTLLLTKSHGRKYSKHLLQAIDWASELDYERRPRNVDIFLEALTGGRDDMEGQKSRGWFG